MKAVYLLIVLLSLNLASRGQSLSIDDLPPQNYFDFWIGTWELTWEAPDGSMESGTNKIEKILEGKVIQENFEAIEGRFEGYAGKSWSVYSSRNKEWKQTWVDSNGGYIDFTGEFSGGKRIFITDRITPQGKSIMQRMVFYNIKQNSFTWDWELSTDKGKSWTLQWRIEYKRK
ncbi:MAG: hypothetical protein U5J95_01940 [Balneolaceae bacterium]|nr:hypothetical protein [Balneolaceae bacterium]